MTRPELQRKLTHMAAFAPALLLPWLHPGQAILIVLAICCGNAWALPRLAFALPRWFGGLYRAQEPGRGALEIVLYPAAVLACLLAFAIPRPDSPAGWFWPPAAAWFCLAFVDGMVGIFCRLLPRFRPLPWNPRKPWLGVLLGAAAAGLPAGLILHGVWPDLSSSAWLLLAALILGCALVESLWFGVADNLTVPFAFAVTLPLIPSPLFPSVPGGISWTGVCLPAAFGLFAFAAKKLTAGGAWLGALLAFVLMAAHPALFLFLVGFFLLGVAATRFGLGKKQALRIAEARNGRRGAAEVFGAMAVAAWMTPLVHLGRPAGGEEWRAALLVCIAPCIAKAMDTVSSEMGKALGGRTISLRTFRAVPVGTEGAVSWAGTLCGLGAAASLALLILPLGWGGPVDVAALLGIAVAANLFESFWGEWAAHREMDTGPHTNFMMTLMAALLAWAFWFSGR